MRTFERRKGFIGTWWGAERGLSALQPLLLFLFQAIAAKRRKRDCHGRRPCKREFHPGAAKTRSEAAGGRRHGAEGGEGARHQRRGNDLLAEEVGECMGELPLLVVVE